MNEEGTEELVTNEDTGGTKGRKLARFDLLPWDAIWQVAEHFGKGAAKYEDRNWERGYDWSLSIGAAFRHLAQFAQGEDVDQETGTPHAAAVAFHALVLLRFMREHRDLDDRPEGGDPPKDGMTVQDEDEQQSRPLTLKLRADAAKFQEALDQVTETMTDDGTDYCAYGCPLPDDWPDDGEPEPSEVTEDGQLHYGSTAAAEPLREQGDDGCPCAAPPFAVDAECDEHDPPSTPRPGWRRRLAPYNGRRAG